MCLHVVDSKPTSIPILCFNDLEPIRVVVALLSEVFQRFVCLTDSSVLLFTVHLKHTSGVTSTSIKSGVPQGLSLGPRRFSHLAENMFLCVLLINGTAPFFFPLTLKFKASDFHLFSNRLPYWSWAPFTTHRNIRKKNIRTSRTTVLTHTHTLTLMHT